MDGVVSFAGYAAFYSYEISSRRFECAFRQDNDLQWPADGQVSVLSVSNRTTGSISPNHGRMAGLVGLANQKP